MYSYLHIENSRLEPFYRKQEKQFAAGDLFRITKQEQRLALFLYKIMDGDALSPLTKAIATKLAGLSTPSNAEDQPCIFKVHEQLLKVNEEAYKPVLLAIGPYNDHDKVGKGIMKKHKLRYLKQMLERRQEHSLEDYIEALRKLEVRARKCYADVECISQNKDEFVEMMLLDGCFIIELFRKWAMLVPVDEHDPIFQLDWMRAEIARDLMLFENQLPYFVLTELFVMSASNQTPVPKPSRHSGEHTVNIEHNYEITCESSTSTEQVEPKGELDDLAISFFSTYLPFPWSVNGSSSHSTEKTTHLLVGDKFKNAEFKHLLDLIYTIVKHSVIPDPEIKCQEGGVKFMMGKICKHLFGLIHCVVSPLLAKKEGYTKMNEDDDSNESEEKAMHNATKLKECGVKFQKAKEVNTMFSINFSNGVLEISPLRIEDETETLLRNLIAYEEYSRDSDTNHYVTDYAGFMDDLINSPVDIELLRQNEIVENWLGDDKVVSTMINKLGHHVAYSPDDSIYAKTRIDMNKYCAEPWNEWMATLRHNYFNSPWAILSVSAAILLLVLTIIQTVFSIIN